eukprot:TRINITY_DN1603_c0_g1_i10.p1 TRINITY_DN1603_c0_g1~~TRINITY_DN1603_c0_g1_i10.p1  ORF type:complete len:486 (+),score=80.06 TRINITY_DN1603_c0_g1_i10:670-2127(+)
MSAESVPIYHDLSSIYPEPEEGKRYEELKKSFSTQYHSIPQFYVRAPGRVNIIGEHVDYSGYCVLPFALVQDIVIAVRANFEHEKSSETKTVKVNLRNLESEKFPNREYEITGDIHIDHKKHDWGNYFLAAYKGIFENIKEVNEKLGKSGSLDLLVSGKIPPSAGLSSSSALVVAFAISIAFSFGLNFSKKELASICAHCEKYIGTEGGGMDQAISLLAKTDTAQLIEFNPLKATDVSLPQGACFVIINSLVDSTKVLTAATNFNLRVVECKLAAAVLAKYLKLDLSAVKKLKHVQDLSGKSLSELVSFVQSSLHSEVYTLDEISSILEISKEEIEKTYMSSGVKVNSEKFELHNRALHVFSETERVYKFQSVCSDSLVENEKRIKELGHLMNQSHESCSKLYECSCQELDFLTNLCNKFGAFGSRLTGAGWGGCVIALVPQHILAEFSEHVKQKYADFLRLKSLPHTFIFSTLPGNGAAIFVPK